MENKKVVGLCRVCFDIVYEGTDNCLSDHHHYHASCAKFVKDVYGSISEFEKIYANIDNTL